MLLPTPKRSFNLDLMFYGLLGTRAAGPLRVEGGGCREAFTNILKHAATRTVSLAVERGTGRLPIRIEDDGKGLDREAAMTPGKRGLVGIEERLALRQAAMQSAPGWRTGAALFAKNLPHEINRVLRAGFFQQIGPVEFNGTRADVERPRGFLAGGSQDDLGQHCAFPRS